MLVTAALSAVPVVGLLALVLAGQVAAGPAFFLAALCIGAAVCFARLRNTEYADLLEDVRRTAGGHAAMPSRLHGEIHRIIRQLADRSADLAERLQIEESILETMPDPLILVGPGRAIIRANLAAQATFGTELSAVLRHPELRAAMERLSASGTAQEADITIAAPIKRQIHATVFRVVGGRMAALLSDRTRERAVEQMRADFVANASHELRTPLASLIGFIDTLRGPAADDPPAQARFLSIMSDQAERMNRLIDDLLSLSRIEMTEHRPPTDHVILPELLRFTAASFEPRVAARDITLQVIIDPALPAVVGDDDQVGQVLQNLIDNAVKYGKPGGMVRVTARPVDPGGVWPPRPGVLLSVFNEGPGIPREHLPRLTERFYRVDTGRSRAVGGTGLGLAIVKHIVNRHRGRLVIESQEGEGATFNVWLPAVMPAPARPALPSETPQP